MRCLVMTVVVLFGARLAAADAKLTLRGGSWVDYGWPAGTPTLAGAGVTLTAKTDATAAVPASNQLVKLTVAVDGKSTYALWFELRDGHRYMVSPDPCC